MIITGLYNHNIVRFASTYIQTKLKRIANITQLRDPISRTPRKYEQEEFDKQLMWFANYRPHARRKKFPIKTEKQQNI